MAATVSKTDSESAYFHARLAKRAELARAGRYIPMTEEMLLGVPFFLDRLCSDSAAFARRMIARLEQSHGGNDPDSEKKTTKIVEILQPFIVEDPAPNSHDYKLAADMLRGLIVRERGDYLGSRRRAGMDIDSLANRFYTYWFFLSDDRLDDRMARNLLRKYQSDSGNKARRWALFRSVIGVTLLGVGVSPSFRKANRSPPVSVDDWHGIHARQPEHIVWAAEDALGAHQAEIVSIEILDWAGRVMGVEDLAERTKNDNGCGDGGGVGAEGGVVVIREIGNMDTEVGKKVFASWKDLLGVRVPLMEVPDLVAVRKKMHRRFPHARALTDRILRDLAGHSEIRMRPLVLVGQPGCGKTEFAMRLRKTLGLPSAVYSCGGVHDGTIAGTARTWSTGQPGLPVNLVRRNKIANPCVVLDEIEKAGTGRHNGNLFDALLTMLEPASAREFHDFYLQAAVNLSHIIWIGTCNYAELLPAPLRDRCRLIDFPSPTVEHLPALASSCLDEIRDEQALDEAWCPPLAPDELEALAGAWAGGSIRKLRRLVEGVLQARELAAGVQ